MAAGRSARNRTSVGSRLPALLVTGPLRAEPLSIGLHNTLYAVGGEVIDGLADQFASDVSLEDLADRLPQMDVLAGDWPAVADVVALREAVRIALHAAVEAVTQDPLALRAINVVSACAASAPDGTVES